MNQPVGIPSYNPAMGMGMNIASANTAAMGKLIAIKLFINRPFQLILTVRWSRHTRPHAL